MPGLFAAATPEQKAAREAKRAAKASLDSRLASRALRLLSPSSVRATWRSLVGDGVLLSAPDAKRFLTRTGLHPRVLASVWRECQGANGTAHVAGALNFDEFGAALVRQGGERRTKGTNDES